MNQNIIPAFPGLGQSKVGNGQNKPLPPKFLEFQTPDGIQRVEVRPLKEIEREACSAPKLAIMSRNGKQLVPTRLTNCEAPPKSYDEPPHRYKSRVDSKNEAKNIHQMKQGSNSNGLPTQFGTTFHHLPNTNRPSIPQPKAPTIPRPYVNQPPIELMTGPLLSNRNAAGKILGQHVKRYADEINVPYKTPEQPVGPDNPEKVLDETWTACWDDSASAVYYYNHETGEATWIYPL